MLLSKIKFVSDSKAGPPFYALNFIPKSSVGPPGLWLAVKRIPPIHVTLSLFSYLIKWEIEGVDSYPYCPTIMWRTPFATAISIMVYIA